MCKDRALQGFRNIEGPHLALVTISDSHQIGHRELLLFLAWSVSTAYPLCSQH